MGMGHGNDLEKRERKKKIKNKQQKYHNIIQARIKGGVFRSSQ
jgi:hypothetical protein